MQGIRKPDYRLAFTLNALLSTAKHVSQHASKLNKKFKIPSVGTGDKCFIFRGSGGAQNVESERNSF